MSRAREMRAQRRAAQFAKFRITELNLVPLVDTFVSIVFFALTTATVGELAPVMPGVRLPSASIGATAYQQLTLGIGGTITLGGHPLMSTTDAAREPSNDPRNPLLVPHLYSALKVAADSIRRDKKIAAGAALSAPLAIQADSTMHYDLLARVLQTARAAGFSKLTLQVNKTGDEKPMPIAPTQPPPGT